MGAGDLTEPVSVRARFERFPATVKGAFILRGEDPDPHQVVFREAHVVGIGLGVSNPIPMATVTLDVAPHRDVFVPFEMPVAELDPGWYTMTCELDVDGNVETYDGGRRFSVPWPRASVRRGSIKVNRSVAMGSSKVAVEQVDCGGDSVKVHLRVDPPGPVAAKLSVDGHRLEVLEAEVDETTGRGRVTAYPVLRTHGTLRIELRGRSRDAEGALDVHLPS
ncbi:MAG: hypothetical protein ACRDHU_03930 [Actinomycetota bacterium]